MQPGLATSVSVSDCSHTKRVTIGHFTPRLPPIAASRRSNRVRPIVLAPVRLTWRNPSYLCPLQASETLPTCSIPPIPHSAMVWWYATIPPVNREQETRRPKHRDSTRLCSKHHHPNRLRDAKRELRRSAGSGARHLRKYRPHLLDRAANAGFRMPVGLKPPQKKKPRKNRGLFVKVVRMKRLELSLRLRNSDLNAARLPIPPHPHTWACMGKAPEVAAM